MWPLWYQQFMGGHLNPPFGGTIAVASGESRDDSSCFADEVGIDFPSIVPAVDRIRSAFLAEEAENPLSTVIQLSAREARDGARVPVDVPVRCICRDCGGRGETWTEPCSRCHGSGAEQVRHHLQVTVPAGVLDGARFRFTLTPFHHPPTRIELRVLVA